MAPIPLARTFALIAALLVAGRTSQEPLDSSCIVETEAGPVRGYLREAGGGEAYLSFRGLPYAQQPVGALRFKPLEPAVPWTEPLDARDEGPVCPQHTLFYGELMAAQSMHEACIHLNVHVPLSNGAECGAGAAAPLPVLVFVHGGGFGYGSGDADVYGPEYLVAEGVLVVTFNYRLGALGFLSLETPQLPGNLGLRDAVAALRWVRRNIAAFGGDPHSVTLAGHSAGAAAAHLLTMSPMARGLFHRVILMSGVATHSWLSTSPANAKRLAAGLLRELNISSADPARALRALQRVDVASLVAATRALQDADGVNAFVPVVERPSALEPFLAEEPGERLARDVPLLIGHTDRECHSFASRFREIGFARRIAANPLLLVPPSLLFAAPPERLAASAAAVERRYFDGAPGSDRLAAFLAYCTDAYYAYPALRLAATAARRRRSLVFAYQFGYSGQGAYEPVRRATSAGHRYAGAAHADDLVYVMRPNSYGGAIVAGSRDHRVQRLMTGTFANFIKTGEPTPERDGNGLAAWPAYTGGSGAVLAVGADGGVAVRRHPRPDLLAFFDELHSAETQSPPPLD